MSGATFTPAPPLLQPFVAFLRHASTAQQNGQPEAPSIWLQAAAYLHRIDDDSVGALTNWLIQQQQYADATTLADVIAQLRPGSTPASFHLGYVLQMANRHRDALAPYRHALTIDPDFPQLRNSLAAALRFSVGDPGEELMLLESAVAADSRDSSAWINLATARRGRLDLEGALEA
jgi:tetratricopeptide (TPR) repeat protein